MLHNQYPQYNDIAFCQAMVHAESVLTGRTVLQVIDETLACESGNFYLMLACETLEDEIIRTWTPRIVADYKEANQLAEYA